MRLKEIVVNLNLELQSHRNKTSTDDRETSSGNDEHQNDFLDQHKQLKIDQSASMCTNKDVGKLVQSILTTVYEPHELKNRSVTGAISKNPKNRGRERIPLSPKKLEFIIGKRFFFLFVFRKFF